MNASTGRSADRQRFETVRVTAWVYTVYWAAIVPLLILEWSGGASVGQKQVAAGVCLAFGVGAYSATRKRRAGYYCCVFLSALILPLPPVGTVLGWNMLRALRRNRDQFGRASRTT